MFVLVSSPGPPSPEGPGNEANDFTHVMIISYFPQFPGLPLPTLSLSIMVQKISKTDSNKD